MSAERWIGWHFLPQDGKLANNPRRNGGKPVETGVPLPQYKSRPIPCSRGYHASRRAINALQYAPGPLVSRVELTGQIIEESNKACAQGRTHISPIVDVSRELRLFGAWCAHRALMAERKAGREPDPRSWQAVRVGARYAVGKATAEELLAAQAAAQEAAREAAQAAARAAARAARDAAWEAARDAAWAAAWDAARDAAWEAAQAAARAAQSDCLTAMLIKRLAQEGYCEE